MREPKKLLILIPALVAALTVVAFLAWDREPQYHGRPLSYWLTLYTAARNHWPHPEGSKAGIKDEAAEAIRAIGPSAVPYLVKWIGYQPSATKTHFIMFMGKFRGGRLGRFVPEFFTVDQDWLRAVSAADGFTIIGPIARSAAPDLLRYALHARNPTSAQHIVRALASLGSDGVLQLSTILTSLPNSDAATLARIEAISELSKMGTNARPAVPALLPFLTNTDFQVATKIAPEVLTNAPAQ